MLRHFFVIISALLLSFSVNGQSLNTYKYVVIPDSYAFLKGEKDRYQLNSLTQFLFEKYGFTAIVKGEPFPEDLQNGDCNALYADVNNVSNMFTVKLEVLLKDCKNETVFISSPGRSKNKEFKKGYQEALRAAFMDVKRLNYSYKDSGTTPSMSKTSGVVEIPAVVENRLVTEPTISAGPKLTEKIVKKAAVVAPPVNKTPTRAADLTEKKIVYVFKKEHYDFRKVEKGFTLHKVKVNTGNDAVGTVFETSRTNNYIVKAGKLSGNGYFDDFGNFVLERINPATGKVITDIFAREDQ